MPGKQFPFVLVSDKARFQCALFPHKDWESQPDDVAVPKEALVLNSCWKFGSQPSALVLSILSKGPCLTLRLIDDGTQKGGTPTFRAWVQLHNHCIGEGGVVVVDYSPICDLFLVPSCVPGASDGEPELVFLGFLVGRGGAYGVAHLLDTSRLYLVLDLDETLLVAFSSSQLEGRLEDVVRRRRAEKAKLERPSTPEVREALLARVQYLETEEMFMREDLLMLRQYMEQDSVEFNSETIFAVDEDIFPDDGSTVPVLSRPVIRLPEHHMVFTRIDPARRETSMLFRIRPGWERLRVLLEGRVGVDGAVIKQRFEVYVCTTAEPGYAWEAWRQLDPHARLIPVASRPTRIKCVPPRSRKQLSRVLGLGQHPPPATAMPLAIIVDDRLEVWDECDHPQILQVQPFMPHSTKDVGEMTDLHDPLKQAAVEEEMRRVEARILAVRANMYFSINEVLKPRLPPATADFMDFEAVIRNAPPRLVSELLQEENLQMPPAAPAPALAYHASFPGGAGFIPQTHPASWQLQGLPPADPRKRDAAAPPDGGPAAKRRVTIAEQVAADPRSGNRGASQENRFTHGDAPPGQHPHASHGTHVPYNYAAVPADPRQPAAQGPADPRVSGVQAPPQADRREQRRADPHRGRPRRVLAHRTRGRGLPGQRRRSLSRGGGGGRGWLGSGRGHGGGSGSSSSSHGGDGHQLEDDSDVEIDIISTSPVKGASSDLLPAAKTSPADTLPASAAATDTAATEPHPLDPLSRRTRSSVASGHVAQIASSKLLPGNALQTREDAESVMAGRSGGALDPPMPAHPCPAEGGAKQEASIARTAAKPPGDTTATPKVVKTADNVGLAGAEDFISLETSGPSPPTSRASTPPLSSSHNVAGSAQGQPPASPTSRPQLRHPEAEAERLLPDFLRPDGVPRKEPHRGELPAAAVLHAASHPPPPSMVVPRQTTVGHATPGGLVVRRGPPPGEAPASRARDASQAVPAVPTQAVSVGAVGRASQPGPPALAPQPAGDTASREEADGNPSEKVLSLPPPRTSQPSATPGITPLPSSVSAPLSWAGRPSMPPSHQAHVMAPRPGLDAASGLGGGPPGALKGVVMPGYAWFPSAIAAHGPTAGSAQLAGVQKANLQPLSQPAGPAPATSGPAHAVKQAAGPIVHTGPGAEGGAAGSMPQPVAAGPNRAPEAPQGGNAPAQRRPGGPEEARRQLQRIFTVLNSLGTSNICGPGSDAWDELVRQCGGDETWVKLKMFLLRMTAFNSALPQPELNPVDGQPWNYRIRPVKRKVGENQWEVVLQLVGKVPTGFAENAFSRLARSLPSDGTAVLGTAGTIEDKYELALPQAARQAVSALHLEADGSLRKARQPNVWRATSATPTASNRVALAQLRDARGVPAPQNDAASRAGPAPPRGAAGVAVAPSPARQMANAVAPTVVVFGAGAVSTPQGPPQGWGRRRVPCPYFERFMKEHCTVPPKKHKDLVAPNNALALLGRLRGWSTLAKYLPSVTFADFPLKPGCCAMGCFYVDNGRIMCFAQTRDANPRLAKRLAGLRLCWELGYKVENTHFRCPTFFAHTYFTVSPNREREMPASIEPLAFPLEPVPPVAPPSPKRQPAPRNAPIPPATAVAQGMSSTEAYRALLLAEAREAMEAAEAKMRLAEFLRPKGEQSEQSAAASPPVQEGLQAQAGKSSAGAAPACGVTAIGSGVAGGQSAAPPHVPDSTAGLATPEETQPQPSVAPGKGQVRDGGNSNGPPTPVGGPPAQAAAPPDAKPPHIFGSVQSASVTILGGGPPTQAAGLPDAKPPHIFGSVQPASVTNLGGGPPTQAAGPPDAKPPHIFRSVHPAGVPAPIGQVELGNSLRSHGEPLASSVNPFDKPSVNPFDKPADVVAPWLLGKPANPLASLANPLATSADPQIIKAESQGPRAGPFASLPGSQVGTLAGSIGTRSNAMGYHFGVPASLGPSRAVWSAMLDAKVQETKAVGEGVKEEARLIEPLASVAKGPPSTKEAAPMIEANAAVAKWGPSTKEGACVIEANAAVAVGGPSSRPPSAKRAAEQDARPEQEKRFRPTEAAVGHIGWPPASTQQALDASAHNIARGEKMELLPGPPSGAGLNLGPAGSGRREPWTDHRRDHSRSHDRLESRAEARGKDHGPYKKGGPSLRARRELKVNGKGYRHDSERAGKKNAAVHGQEPVEDNRSYRQEVRGRRQVSRQRARDRRRHNKGDYMFEGRDGDAGHARNDVDLEGGREVSYAERGRAGYGAAGAEHVTAYTGNSNDRDRGCAPQWLPLKKEARKKADAEEGEIS